LVECAGRHPSRVLGVYYEKRVMSCIVVKEQF
jgi:hypothetical protein